MSTEYRALRLRLLQEAIATLEAGGGLPERRLARLQREQVLLGADDWSTQDRTLLALMADWTWGPTRDLRAAVAEDPVLVALGREPLITEEQAIRITELRSGWPVPPDRHVDDVLAAVGDDEAVLAELVHVATSAWLGLGRELVRPYPFDDVGVLLPLRLETLFDGPGTEHNDDPTRWRLSLRVVPDEASVRRDDAHVSDGELTAVRAFWRAARVPGPFDPSWLDSPVAEVAWSQLCAQVAPERAAWLLGALVPVVGGDDEELVVEPPAGMPEGPQDNRVGGLPEQLTVWAVTGDETRHAVGRLPMDPDAVIDAEALTLQLPERADPAREAWWSSWSTAVSVGLAGDWLLEEGVTPETLETLYVVGLGDEAPDGHFRAQVEAGELGVLRLGAATNTVHGAPAADLGTDAATWRMVARARLAQSRDDTVGWRIEQSLTGNPGDWPSFPGADAHDDTLDSAHMAQALWPALLGRWLNDVWEVGDAFRVGCWAFPPADDGIPSHDDVKGVLRRDPEDPSVLLPGAWLCPEGPLMPLRIGDQPYGLLPVTALSQWSPAWPQVAVAPDQDQLEEAMARQLVVLRAEWAAAGRGSGTTVGVDAERYMELLGRDAVSAEFVLRSFLPASWWAVPYQLGAGADQLQELEDVARQLNARAEDLLRTSPAASYLAGGWPRANQLPLVQPHTAMHHESDDIPLGRVPLTTFMALLVEEPRAVTLDELFARFAPWIDRRADSQLRALPDSLLVRLLTHACQLGAEWLRRGTGDDLGLLVLRGQMEAVRALTHELDQPSWAVEDVDPDTNGLTFGIAIPEERRLQLERALRTTIDGAAHRLDPWITGFAWQRLQQHSSSERHQHRLGAYGWVEGPFRGQPGPTDGGRLHTPSYDQTLAAVVLRDGFLTAAREGVAAENGRNPWEMDIGSRTARLAEEIADEVRLGFHVFEIVGRHVEDVVADHQQVTTLRTSTAYAMRPERRDPQEVCHGIKALKGLLGDDPPFPIEPAQRQELATLHDALDTYGDLLMADGVMQLVHRQPERAAETMDAAAGFSRPPTFEFLRTPPSGYQLESQVLAVLPHVEPGDLPAGAGPVTLADPSLAAFVEQQVGTDWTWTVVDRDPENPGDPVMATVTLAQLELVPADALGLSEGVLAELVRRHLGLVETVLVETANREWIVRDGTGLQPGPELGRVRSVDLGSPPSVVEQLSPEAVLEQVREAAGAPPDSPVEQAVPADLRVWELRDTRGNPQTFADVASLGLTPEQADALAYDERHLLLRRSIDLGDPQVRSPHQHRRAQQLAAATGSRPAAGRDVVRDPGVQQSIDADVHAGLVDRYTAVHEAGSDLVDELRTAAAGDEDALPGLLRRARAWGITPISERADADAWYAAVLSQPPPGDATPRATLAQAVAKTLEERLHQAPQPGQLLDSGDLGQPVDHLEDRRRKGLPDGVPSLAAALADLAMPEGKLGITATWGREDLVAQTQLQTGASEAGLDEQWLTVVAAVRPALARLEALQLGLDTPLEAWTSSPGDPFRTATVAENRARREAQRVTSMSFDQPFVAAYGAAGAWAGEQVAVGLVDAFSEAVPMPQRSTSLAFGFNAPAARAQQAILLAVPPRPRQRLDDELLLQILVETRELAHARTARLEHLGDLQGVVPTAWLASSGSDRVRLEPYPLFT